MKIPFSERKLGSLLTPFLRLTQREPLYKCTRRGYTTKSSGIKADSFAFVQLPNVLRISCRKAVAEVHGFPKKALKEASEKLPAT